MTRFILLITLFSLGVVTKAQVYKLEPSENESTFLEQDRIFAYKPIDSVIVSIGFDRYLNDEFIMDVTIDNQSMDTFMFDPDDIYLFRYLSDTSLQEKKLYYAIDPELQIDSIERSVIMEQNKIKRNTALSILFAAAYVTAEIAGISKDVPYEALEALDVAHSVSQVVLDELRINAFNRMDCMYFTKDYWQYETLRKTTIGSKEFYSGKVHFKAPYADIIRIYIPANHHSYNFEFYCYSGE